MWRAPRRIQRALKCPIWRSTDEDMEHQRHRTKLCSPILYLLGIVYILPKPCFLRGIYSWGVVGEELKPLGADVGSGSKPVPGIGARRRFNSATPTGQNGGASEAVPSFLPPFFSQCQKKRAVVKEIFPQTLFLSCGAQQSFVRGQTGRSDALPSRKSSEAPCAFKRPRRGLHRPDLTRVNRHVR